MRIQDMILNWHYERNLIDGSSKKDQLCKLVQELGEVSDVICKDDLQEFILEMGDMLVIQIALCEMFDVSIEECMWKAYDKIKDRKGILYNGVFIKETDSIYESLLKKRQLDE